MAGWSERFITYRQRLRVFLSRQKARPEANWTCSDYVLGWLPDMMRILTSELVLKQGYGQGRFKSYASSLKFSKWNHQSAFF